ncbi:MAG: LysE family translocator [Tetrasphaera sp.]
MIPGITTAGLLQLLVTSIVIIVVPGPSVMFLIGQALGAGRRLALVSVLGHTAGMAVTALVMTVGVGTVISRSPTALTVLRVVGGSVLVAIGLRYLRSRWAHVGELDAGAVALPGRRVLWSSVAVGLTNPKGVIMYGVIVPGFLAPLGAGESAIPALLLLCFVPVLVGLACDSLWVVIASMAREWFGSSPARTVWLMRVGGVLIIALGVLVAAGM